MSFDDGRVLGVCPYRVLTGALLLLFCSVGHAVQHVAVGFEDPVQVTYGISELGSDINVVVYDKIVEDSESFYGVSQKYGTNRLWICESESYQGARSLAASCYAFDTGYKDRAEFRSVQGSKSYALNFGQEMFYGYAMKIDTNSTPPTAGMHIMQAYQNNCGSQIPLTFSFTSEVTEGVWSFVAYARTDVDTQPLWSINIPLGVWTKMVWRLRPAHPELDDGLISLWVNDEQVFSWSGNWGHVPLDETDQTLDLRCGVYRGSCERQQTIYYDQIKYADSYYEADPDTEIDWGFRAGLDDWTAVDDALALLATNNVVDGVLAESGSGLVSPSGLNVFCTNWPRIMVRMKNSSEAANASLCFSTFDEAVRDEFDRAATAQTAHTVNVGSSAWMQAGNGVSGEGNDWFINDGGALRLRNRVEDAVLYNTGAETRSDAGAGFILQVDLMGLQSGAYVGVVFNYADENNYYAVRFKAASSTWQVLQMTSSGWDVFYNENLSTGTFAEDTYYTVTVVSSGTGRFDFSICETGSDIAVVSGSVTDSASVLDGGWAGVYGTAIPAHIAAFDHFVLQTSDIPGSDPDKQVSLPALIQNDSHYTFYEFDMASNTNWTGILNQLWFDPSGHLSVTSGTYSVDFVDLTALPSDQSIDPDQDGFSNHQEMVCGTDPYDAQSRFQLESSLVEPGGINVRIPMVENRTYSVFSSTNLTSGQWLPMTVFNSASNNVQDVFISGGMSCFLKVDVDLP
jgi:hypothetical protein